MQLKYLKLINTLFCEVNPVPVKAASVLMGLCGPEIRLPLCEPEAASLEKIKAAMQAHGLI
jgi:4-hydroxy-tetrahydrodipicolinate synthase